MTELRRCDRCARVVPLAAFYTERWQRQHFRSDLQDWEDTCRACTERVRIAEEREES